MWARMHTAQTLAEDRTARGFAVVELFDGSVACCAKVLIARQNRSESAANCFFIGVIEN
jgi:hypothetical protein